MTWVWIILGVIVVGGAIALVVIGVRTPEQDDDPLAARLAEFSERGEMVSLEDIELSQPFAERVPSPLLQFREQCLPRHQTYHAQPHQP